MVAAIINVANAQQNDMPFNIMGINVSKVSQNLLTSNTTERQEMIISLADKVDVITMKKDFEANNTPIAERTELVIRLLQEKANATQPTLLELLRNNSKVDKNSIQAYWIANAIIIKAELSVLEILSNMDEIEFIELSVPMEVNHVIEENCEDKIEGITAINGIEPGLAAIRAPAMWSLGYTGFGTKVLSIDTGVDGTHPAFNYSYEGIYSSAAQAWYPINGTPATPVDCDGHGTHTVGTMIGLDRENNDTIGVAFDATWMGTPPITCNPVGSSGYIPITQWAINPDGDVSTTDDMPTVICNSWGYPLPSSSACNGVVANAFAAVEAVGIAAVFAAGNDGPNLSTIGSPAIANTDIVSIFSVGALDGNATNLLVAGFSSRGPTVCGDTGSLLIKPEVSAPGVSVRSAYVNGGYASFSGTSMAAPHVAGAILLLKQAFPTLSGHQFKLALYYSAIDLGIPGEDNDYGMGIIDVYAAYQYLINQGNTPVTPYSNRDLATQSIDLPENICNASLSISPSAKFVNLGIDTIYNAVIRYTLSNGQTGTVQWSGIAIPEDTIFIQVPVITLAEGLYEFEIKPESINGLPDDRPVNNYFPKTFLLTTAFPITTTGTTACPDSEVLLNATHPSTTGKIHWYTAATGGPILNTGNSIILPSITNDATYYADVIETVKVGAIDNSIGNGVQSNNLNTYLEFDCFSPFVLRTVKVYTTTSGGRKIVLKDKNGNVLAQKLTAINQNGENIISLNWKIQRNEGLQLSFELASNCYLNHSGATFPYTIPSVVSITGSNWGTSGYPFFYDWEVEYGHPCGRVPATATLGAGTMETNFSTSTDSLDLNTTNGEITFIDSTQNATSWFWDFGDGNTSILMNPTHTYTQPGTYEIYLQTANSTGCSDATNKTIEVVNFPVSTNGIEQLNNSVKIYPNPTNDILNIELRLDKITEVKFQLFDAIGQLVLTSDRKVSNNEKTLLNLNDLPSGVYFLQIRINGNILSKKVIRY
jgi:subtilisin family serine protease